MNNSINNNFKVLSNYYDHNKNKSGSLATIQESTSPASISLTADAGLADHSPCVAVEYSGNIYDSNGNTTGGINICDDFSCTFSVDTTFVKNNGYNGCISFVWTNKSLGENIIPGNCQNIKYDNAVQLGETPIYNGLFDDFLMENDMKGFSVTLYPSTSSEDYMENLYTTKINRYMITYKTKDNKLVHITNENPENSINIALFDENWNLLDITVSVKHNDGNYDFYINDILLASVNEEESKIDVEWGEDEGYFAATMIGSHYVEANLRIGEIDHDIHLTLQEKRNLANLGASVLNYYEDDDTDDTGAFQRALRDETVRRVYVPGGTYKITGELVVRDNCELELAQDAVLEFDFSGTASATDSSDATESDDTSGTESATDDTSATDTTITEEGLVLWEDNEIKAAKKCITLNMLSSLVGNHATIRVLDDFDGIVIYASTRSHPDRGIFKNIPPFTHYCPQWKPARYVTDINIVMPNSDGVHASDDGTCNGTAVFIEGYRRDADTDGNEGSTFIWGLEYTGLRIAGAFRYGVYGRNNYNESADDWAWTNDMKINGLIEGCEVGVFLDNCNYAYISTLIQPKHATDDAKTTYAKYGIFLKECQYVDLTGSKVWDWDKKRTLGGPNWDTTNPKASENYQHIGLKGDCKGLLLDDYLYHRLDEYDIRDLIYTDTAANFDTMSILQLPVSKFIRVEKETTEGDDPVTLNKIYLQNRVYIKPESIIGLEKMVHDILKGGN